MDDQRREYTLEENVNWISYNLKRIADMMEVHLGIEKPKKQNYNNTNNNRNDWNNNNQKQY